MKKSSVLNENNFKFNKKYGQNFIFDKNLLKAIIKDSNITEEDDVLEIGPGAGTLTEAIAEKAKKVVSYEIDINLKPILNENLKDLKNSRVIFADALNTDIQEIEKNFEGNYKIVANLPYYITTPLIFKFVKQTKKVISMSIMVQKEVGERLIAKNTDKDYGAISVILDFYGDVKILRQVPRKMFVPSPNVDSCVVQINFQNNKYNCNQEIFEKIVKAAFANRRKTLANNLSTLVMLSKTEIAEMLEQNGFAKDIRGDALSTQDFVKISLIFDKYI